MKTIQPALRQRLQRSANAWLAMSQRRQLRRVRLFDPQAVLPVDSQEAGKSSRCLRP